MICSFRYLAFVAEADHGIIVAVWLLLSITTLSPEMLRLGRMVGIQKTVILQHPTDSSFSLYGDYYPLLIC